MSSARASNQLLLKARTVMLFIAMLSAGVGAGFFLTYNYTIMPGLATTDDRTFVGAFQGLERMFGQFDYGVNWPVMFSFFGGPVLAVLALVLNRRSRQLVGLTAVALVLLLSTVVTTLTFNVPRNNDITAAGDPDTINVTQVREDFGEGPWRAWNLVRTTTTSAAFVCLGWALVVRARQSDGDTA